MNPRATPRGPSTGKRARVGSSLPIAVLALFLTTGCSVFDTEEGSNPLAEMERNRALWVASEVESYALDLRRVCECPPEVVREVVVTFREGRKRGVTYADTGELVRQDLAQLFPDVEGLFRVIDDAIRGGADRVEVRYDGELGYPIEVGIDFDEVTADDELGFVVDDLRRDPHAETQAELDEALSRWGRLGTRNYDAIVRRSCFCAPQSTGSVVMEVRAGVAVSREWVGGEEPVPREFAHLFFTIPELFDLVQEAIDRSADRIVARYDPEFGYPAEASIDYRFGVADEEIAYEVLAFEPVTP